MQKRSLVVVLLSLFFLQGYLMYLVKHPQEPNWSNTTVQVSAQADQSVVFVRVPGVAIGSGVLIDDRGYILTCEHVVDQAPGSIVDVSFYKEQKVVKGTVVWSDKYKDLALIKTNLPYAVPAMRIAKKDSQIGELVLSVGHPFGIKWTVGYGIVSRYTPDSTPKHNGPDFIQHTAMTHPGNSGGPIVNMQGEIVGIDARTLQMGEQYVPLEINTAISVPTIRAFLNQAEQVIPPSPELTSCSEN